MHATILLPCAIIRQIHEIVDSELELLKASANEVLSPVEWGSGALYSKAPMLTRRGAVPMQKEKPTHTKKTVLVVEAEHVLRRLVCNVLAKEGYRVTVARDGKQALQTAARHDSKIDLLVANVIVPGFYG